MARKRIAEEPEGSKTGFQEPGEMRLADHAESMATPKKGKQAKPKKAAKKHTAPHSAKKAEKAAGKKLAKVAGAFEAFRPASEVLTVVRAVPTRFVQIDHATGVGGWPIERLTIVHGPSGHGKALSSQTPVLTPTGWRPIGQLRVGEKVIGGDGKPCSVTGIFPQGRKDLYEVEFNDGTKIECCAEHLWSVSTTGETARGKYERGPRPQRKRILRTEPLPVGKVRSLGSMFEDFVPGEYAIPLVEPVQFEHRGKLPIDPYLLGLLLGDGGFTHGSITFTKPEEDIRKRLAGLVREAGDEVTVDEADLSASIHIVKKSRARDKKLSNTARSLDELGLLWIKSAKKFIPPSYLFASVEDRLRLLRGLCDTDGYVVADGGAVEFSSSSPRLAKEVEFLARSLGAFVNVGDSRIPVYTYKGERREGLPSVRMILSFNDGTVPVSSEKHLAKWKRRELLRRRTFLAIRPIGKAEATCIAVDSPGNLYVAKDFIVTHNTSFALGLAGSFLDCSHYADFVDAEMCYDSATEVLTRRGFVPWPDVLPEDILGCWDPVADSLVYEKPRELTRQRYQGKMYRVDHGGVDLLVTPKHSMYIQTKYEFKKGEGVQWKDWKLVRADELDGRVSIRYRKHAPRTTVADLDLSSGKAPRVFPLNDSPRALLRLIGFFIGDGWVGKKRGRRNAICFGLTKPRKVAYLREVCLELGWKIDDLANRNYVVRAEDVGKIFREEFYDESGHKRIPEYLLDLNKDDAAALLEGLRASDGSAKRSAWEYFTTSLQVADAVQRLVLHAGGAAHVHTAKEVAKPSSPLKGRVLHPRMKMNRVMVLSRMLEPIVNYAGKRNTSWVDYSGEIHCAHTRTGILVVRRNGKIVLSGNTTPPDFARKMIGPSFDSDRFFACRPSNLEEVIARVRFFCRGVQKMREKDPKLTGLVIIDSLKKLMPEGTVDAILKAAKGGEDISAGQDRSGQIAAKANTAWMNELTILLVKACVGMVIIGREMENPDAKPHEKKSGWDFKLGGGKAPFFEASIVARVELAGEVKEPGSGSGEYDPSLRVFGERHRVVIYKTKVSAHESKKTVGFFHTSNGVLIPEGFDRARDVIEMAERFEVIDRSGSWYSHRGNKIGNGRDASVVALTKDVDWLASIERDVRSKFSTRAQVVVEHGSPFVENTGEVIA